MLGLTGNLPPFARREGRGVSGLLSVQLSSPDDSIFSFSISARCFSFDACCLINFLTCVAITASLSFSFAGEGTLSLILQISGGGNFSGFPSSFSTCRLLISPRHRGSSSILFFAIASTFSEVKLAIFCGMTVILFLLTSRISREGIPRICDSLVPCPCVMHSIGGGSDERLRGSRAWHCSAH